MCGRSMYCKTCRLALEIRLCRVTSSLLPWLGNHALSSATVQRSSGAAAILIFSKSELQTPGDPLLENRSPSAGADESGKRKGSLGGLRLPSLSAPAGFQDGVSA